MMKVIVKDRRGRELGSFDVDQQTTVAKFKQQFFAKNKKYEPSRQYFTLGDSKDAPRLTDPDKKLVTDYHVKDNDILIFKDLGYQVAWTTVFLVEYFGPILVHSLIYFLPSIFYSTSDKTEKSLQQKIAFGLVVFHYIKRELETLFVHRFSNDTMPVFNIFKNSAHYWILSGLLIAYPLYHPLFTATLPLPLFYTCVAVFLIAELGNLHAHLVLRGLRNEGTRQRGIPKGQLFSLVSCANYTWESLAWFSFALLSDCATSWFFWFVSTAQMFAWAVKKHKRYRQEFKDYPRRKAMFPFIA